MKPARILEKGSKQLTKMNVDFSKIIFGGKL